MCGILGELAFGNELINKHEFINLLSLSSKRGPDNSGYLKYKNIFQFGFNRLSIIDLSKAANQPIQSKDGRYTMVYNGEVYNYLSIKNNLIKKGVNFSGTGDSEVLIEAFSIYGIRETLSIIDGMFSIGLFDKKEKIIYLIRDHAGIKPLHYGYNKNTLVFASQYNQVATHPSFRDNNINSKVLKLFLEQHYIPAPFGILKNTYQVMPGELVSFSLMGKIKNLRYWEFQKQIKPSIYDKGNAIELISNSLENSVKMQLISDVPVGAFLSSGVDSSLICSFLSKYKKQQAFSTFTIGSDSKKFDESHEAKIFADIIGVRNENYLMNGSNVLLVLEDIMKSITEPFADISILPTYITSKIAKNEVKVSLSGDGGDELFFGYERFWSIAKNINLESFPHPIKYMLYGLDKVLSKNEKINSLCLYGRQAYAHYSLHNRFSIDIQKKIIPELNDISLPKSYSNYDYPNTKIESKLLNYMRYAEFYGMMQKTLKKVDQASMANSIEVRVPFLGKKFIEDSIKIDPFLNYGPNFAKKSKKKNILIDILKNRHPMKMVNQNKRGFSIPLHKWITEDLLKPMSEVMMDKSMIQYFGMNDSGIMELIKEHQSGIDHKWPIFTLFSLFSWKNNLS